MDLIRLLRSLEELLYEIMSLMVFYPRTLFRIMVNPVRVAQYTHDELHLDNDVRFSSTVSPVMMLIISVIVAHGLEMVWGVRMSDASSPLFKTLFGSEQGLLVTRSIIFGLYALIAAAWVLKQTHVAMDRDTLREPFFIESYLVSPLAVFLSMASVLLRASEAWSLIGLALALLICVWYLWAQTFIYRHLLKTTTWRSFVRAVTSFTLTTFIVIATVLLVFHSCSK